jgi:hypothetical protein
MFEPARAIAITSPKYGSAYRIGGRLVLTCKHLLGDKATIGSDCTVKCEQMSEAVKATIVWMGDGVDVALVELPESIEPISAATFGKLPKEYNDQKVPFQFYGAPSHAGTLTEEQKLKSGWKQVEGVIYLADRPPQGLLSLRVNPDSQASPIASGASPWGGASGAAIVCQGLILAVQQQHQRLDQPNSLQAQPLHVVYGDLEWRLILRKHNINLEFVEIELPSGGKPIVSQAEPIVPRVEIKVTKLKSEMLLLLNSLDYVEQTKKFVFKSAQSEKAMALMVQSPCRDTQRWLMYRLFQKCEITQKTIKIRIPSNTYFDKDDLWLAFQEQLGKIAKATVAADKDSVIQYFCEKELSKPILILVPDHDQSKQCFEELMLGQFWEPLNQELKTRQSRRSSNARIILCFAMQSLPESLEVEDQEIDGPSDLLRLPPLNLTSKHVEDWLHQYETSTSDPTWQELVRRLRSVTLVEQQQPVRLLHQLCKGVELPGGIEALKSLWGSAS